MFPLCMGLAKKRIIIIGGGIVGLGTAIKLGKKFPGVEIVVLEKEPDVARHQSGNNSGVLHAGLYYKPGSIKARLAVSGIREMVAFCQDHNIRHEICGKLVVAVDETERERLHNLYERGTKNGLQGMRKLNREQMLEIEPHVAGIEAVHVPQEGIVDYVEVAHAMLKTITAAGGQVVTRAKVIRLEAKSNGWLVETENPNAPPIISNTWEADYIVNCGGLHCDRIAELAGEKRDVRIIPFRGEYYKIRPERQNLVRHLIYPVPDPQFPFLGVHFTRLIEGGVEAGPNAVLALSREGYTWRKINLTDLWDAVSFSGLWRFMGRHKRMSWHEIQRSFSKDLFAEALQRLVPDIKASDLAPGGAGVRAQAMSPQGELLQDFCLVERPRALHVLNAPSPGATASLAIGGEIAEYVGKNFKG
ncbi:MAG: L-2-hydroxyglutarate oxidase [Limisphaerales bacterium]